MTESIAGYWWLPAARMFRSLIKGTYFTCWCRIRSCLVASPSLNALWRAPNSIQFFFGTRQAEVAAAQSTHRNKFRIQATILSRWGKVRSKATVLFHGGSALNSANNKENCVVTDLGCGRAAAEGKRVVNMSKRRHWHIVAKLFFCVVEIRQFFPTFLPKVSA